VLTDVLTGLQAQTENGELTIKLPPLTARLMVG
jgi:hypothetical protein